MFRYMKPTLSQGESIARQQGGWSLPETENPAGVTK